MTELSRENFTDEQDNKNERKLKGIEEKVMTFIAFSYGLFHLITAIYPLSALEQRSIHIGFGLVLAYGLYKSKFVVRYDYLSVSLSLLFIVNVYRYNGVFTALLTALIFLFLGYQANKKIKQFKWFEILTGIILLLSGSSLLLGWAGSYLPLLIFSLSVMVLLRNYLSFARFSLILMIYFIYYLITNFNRLSLENIGANIFLASLVIAVIVSGIWLLSRMKKIKLDIQLYDWVAMVFILGASSFILFNSEFIANNPGESSFPLLILGALLLLFILEASRRVMGLAFPLIAGVFVIYGLFGPYFDGMLGHRGVTERMLLEQLYLSFIGFYGTVTSVTASVIGVFIVFGSILVVTGGGRTFMDLSLWLAGRKVGGPAKVSIVSSGMFGLFSGSAAANVAVTGNFTIPMMKKLGYRPEFAGAVEAVASTGGQLVPPIMGAAVFVMAEIIDTPYTTIMIASIIPAFLYYLSAMMSVHFQSLKRNIKGIEDEKLLVTAKDILRADKLVPLFGPIGVLLFFIFRGYTPEGAAFWSVIIAIVLYFVFSNIKTPYSNKKLIPLGIGLISSIAFLSILDFSEAQLIGFLIFLIAFLLIDKKDAFEKFKLIGKGLIDAGKGLVMISVLSGTAQIIIVIIGQTGLGVKFSSLISTLTENNFLLGLIVAMLITLILGMGIPTVAAYVVAASVIGPPLIQAGIEPLTAHLFLFYFALLSAITPPICTSVYVASAIANSDWLKTAFYSLRIGLPAFIVPFMFVYNGALLMDGSITEIVLVITTASIGVSALAASVIGYFIKPNTIIETILLLVGAILSIIPEFITDTVGIALIIIVYVIQRYFRKEKNYEASRSSFRS